MKFHQIFECVDAASFGVDEENRLEILQCFLNSDYEEEEAAINLNNGISGKKRKKRGNNEYNEADRTLSLFSQKYLHHPNKEQQMSDDSKFGKKFRLRFRVPYVLFLGIVEDIRKKYKVSNKNKYGLASVKLELLVLGSLRFIATGCSFDLIEELTSVSDEKHRTFFRDHFSYWGMRASKDHITMPETKEEIRHIMGLYKRNGHPGCIGSVDCVHVVWDKCRSGMQALCTGKEKEPTLVFEVAGSHTRKILSVSSWFFGTYNDKTILKYDPVMDTLKNEPYKDIEWIALARDVNGEIIELKQKGVYFICDGGYHFWQTLIPPYKDQLEGSSMMEWSKHLESSRKDIECVFGILKKRFLFF